MTDTNCSTGLADLRQLADEIERSEGLLCIVPGQGTLSLGIRKTAAVIAGLRAAAQRQQEPGPSDDITEIVRANSRSTLIGFRDQITDRDIDFICDQVARKSQLDYVELEPRMVAPAYAQRNAVIEECAKVLDEAAQDWRRIRDPGMANNAAAYAKKIRALSLPSTEGK